jgi:hypothetical protein
MEIKRYELDSAFQTFALAGSGIVIGPPGVGKTHLLKNACIYFHREGIPFLYLPVDKLSGDSASDPGEELGLNCSLLDYLQIQITSEYKGPRILLIDAFDAARSDENRRYYLNLIYQVHNRLGGAWNVIVSVRTYDARRSELLMDLFPPHTKDTPEPAYQMPSIFCRHFAIPELTERELQEAIDSNPHMRAATNGASREFRQLLRIPFNLVLLEKLIDRDPDFLRSTPIRTEAELLDLFWKQRVLEGDSGEKKRSLLTKLTRAMVEQYVLSVRREEISGIEEDNTLKDLLTLEILVDASLTGQRVAYAHNILFDYAVSVLLIDDEPPRLVEFISEEPARTLFLRPSLYYHFARLWQKKPDAFWEVFWYIRREADTNIRLFARLLPTSVIVREARSMDQLSPLLTALSDPRKEGGESILHTLQALRAFQNEPDTLLVENDALWAQFLRALVAYMDSLFAWEFALVASDICTRADKGGDEQILQVCGEISRKFLEWVWGQRNDAQKKEWSDTLGAHWVVPLVIKTYSTDPKRSRELLEVVLQVMREEDFPLSYIIDLADHVDKIWPYDPGFAAEVYRAVWTHTEESNEQTRLGGSALLQLYSTRRQDLQACRYRLMEHTSNFLRDKPETATRTMIQCLNEYIIINYIRSYQYNVEDIREEFPFREKTAYYIPDGSYIWSWGSDIEEEIQMADKLYAFIGELTSSEMGRAKIPVILDIFQEHAQVALLWRKLLELARRYPEVLAQPLFDLCIAPPVMEHNETHEVLGDFLAVATPMYTDEQVHRIEEAILGIPKGEMDPEEKEYFIRRRDRLLSKLPLDRLKTAEAREIKNNIKADYLSGLDKPLFSISAGFTKFTEDDWLELQGTDPKRSENQSLLKYSEPLNAFSEDWLNKEPTPESISRILPVARELWEELNKPVTAEPAVYSTAWTNLASCVSAMSKGVKDPKSDEFQFCRSVLLRCAVHEAPKPDPKYDSEFNSPSWSPAPRNEAASGLVILATHGPDPEILTVIERLSQDQVPSVRYLTMRHLLLLYRKSPETFWKIVEERSKNEQNRVVLKALCYGLGRAAISKDRKRAQRSLEILVNDAIKPDDPGDPLEPLIHLLVRLDLIDQDAWAGEVTSRFLAEPSRYAGSLLHATSAALSLLRSPSIDSRQEGKCTDRVVQWLDEATCAVADGVRQLNRSGHGPDVDEKVKTSIKSLYETIDRIVMQLRFAINERGATQDTMSASPAYRQKRDFYFKIKPLLEKISSFALDKEIGVMFAPTTHWFMQLLNSVLAYDPEGVIHMAADVVEASKSTGYPLDPLALNDFIPLVETTLADHRYSVQEGEALQDLLRLLDAFAESGDPKALQLVWRLDELYR